MTNFTGPRAALILVRDNLNVSIDKAKMELEAIEQVFLLINNFEMPPTFFISKNKV